jgi:hypothetical protein
MMQDTQAEPAEVILPVPDMVEEAELADIPESAAQEEAIMRLVAMAQVEAVEALDLLQARAAAQEVVWADLDKGLTVSAELGAAVQAEQVVTVQECSTVAAALDGMGDLVP